MPETGDSIGPFRVDAALGTGGMGAVYRATDTRLNRVVALKLLHPDRTLEGSARSRLLREAQAAGRVTHPAIGAVYEAGEWQGQPYIVMALYEGETLAARLARGPLAIEEAESILRQVASGLAAAHGAGVVHRDLKPSNVMLTIDGQVKVLDFGLAKVLAPGPGATHPPTQLTGTGAIMGTIAYMSPEQARGEAVDARTDVWSLGVMAYEMLAGATPFRAASDPATLSRILLDDPPPLAKRRRDVPPWLVALIHRMLRKPAAERPPDAAAVLRSLEARKAPAAPRRWMVAAGAGAILVLSLAVAIARTRPGARATGLPSTLVALPCVVRGDPESRFLADAVPGMLTTALAQVNGLQAQVPPTSTQWDPARGDLAIIGRLFRVGSCLRCEIVAEGDRLALDVWALTLPAGATAWREHFEGSRSGLPDLLRRTADGVRRAYAPGSAPISGTSVAKNPEAELQLRRGRYLANQYAQMRDEDALRKARQALARALELDPGLASAASALGWAAYYPMEAGVPPAEAAPEAQQWAARALEIDPDCAEAWSLRGAVAAAWGNETTYRQALEYTLKGAAIRSSPCRGSGPPPALHLGGLLRRASGELAIAAMDESMREDPLSSYGPMIKAAILNSLGRPADALEAVAPLLELERKPLVLLTQAYALIGLDRIPEAEVLMRESRALAAEGRIHPNFLLDADVALAMAKNDKEAVGRTMVAVRKLLDRTPEENRFERPHAYTMARWKHYEEAIEVLTRIDAQGHDWSYEILTENPDMAPLLTDPRMSPVLEHSRARYMEWLDVLEAARARGELPSYLAAPLERILQRVGRKLPAATP